MEEIKETLLEILEDLHPDIDFETCEAMVDDKILDSFDIISLISEINNEFDITITAEKIIPENFNTVEALCNMIYELTEE